MVHHDRGASCDVRPPGCGRQHERLPVDLVPPDVSPATIYKSYGGKVGLLRSLCRRALEGAGPVPAEERSNVVQTNADPERVMQGWQLLIAEVAPRVLPLLLVLHGVSRREARDILWLSSSPEIYDLLSVAAAGRCRATAGT